MPIGICYSIFSCLCFLFFSCMVFSVLGTTSLRYASEIFARKHTKNYSLFVCLAHQIRNKKKKNRERECIEFWPECSVL